MEKLAETWLYLCRIAGFINKIYFTLQNLESGIWQTAEIYLNMQAGVLQDNAFCNKCWNVLF